MASEGVIIAAIAAVGGSGFGGIITSLLNRRVTVGDAWQKFVQQQGAQIEALKKDLSETRGELKAAQRDIAKLERHEADSLFWQAKVIQREDIVAALLNAQGIKVPAMPEAPAMRPRLTRAEDRD